MISGYKRIFLSDKFFNTVSVGAMLLMLCTLLLERLSGELTFFPVSGCLVCLAAFCGLISSYKKDDIIRMSGFVSIILVYEFLRYAYEIEQFLSVGREQILILGLLGCMMLSGCFVIFFIVIMVIFNHFTMELGRSSGRTKIAVNQISILVLLFAVLALVIEGWLREQSILMQLSDAVKYAADVLTFAAIACSELIIAIDRRMMDYNKEAEK